MNFTQSLLYLYENLLNRIYARRGKPSIYTNTLIAPNWHKYEKYYFNCLNKYVKCIMRRVLDTNSKPEQELLTLREYGNAPLDRLWKNENIYFRGKLSMIVLNEFIANHVIAEGLAFIYNYNYTTRPLLSHLNNGFLLPILQKEELFPVLDESLTFLFYALPVYMLRGIDVFPLVIKEYNELYSSMISTNWNLRLVSYFDNYALIIDNKYILYFDDMNLQTTSNNSILQNFFIYDKNFSSDSLDYPFVQLYLGVLFDEKNNETLDYNNIINVDFQHLLEILLDTDVIKRNYVIATVPRFKDYSVLNVKWGVNQLKISANHDSIENALFDLGTKHSFELIKIVIIQCFNNTFNEALSFLERYQLYDNVYSFVQYGYVYGRRTKKLLSSNKELSQCGILENNDSSSDNAENIPLCFIFQNYNELEKSFFVKSTNLIFIWDDIGTEYRELPSLGRKNDFVYMCPANLKSMFLSNIYKISIYSYWFPRHFGILTFSEKRILLHDYKKISFSTDISKSNTQNFICCFNPALLRNFCMYYGISINKWKTIGISEYLILNEVEASIKNINFIIHMISCTLSNDKFVGNLLKFNITTALRTLYDKNKNSDLIKYMRLWV